MKKKKEELDKKKSYESKESIEDSKLINETVTIKNFNNFNNQETKKDEEIAKLKNKTSTGNEESNVLKNQDLKGEEKKSIFEILFGSKEKELPKQNSLNTKKEEETSSNKKSEIKKSFTEDNSKDSKNLINKPTRLDQEEIARSSINNNTDHSNNEELILKQEELKNKDDTFNENISLDNEELNKIKIENSQKDEIETSFLQLKEVQSIDKKKTRRFIKGRDSVGVLVPVTGTKSFAGEIVLNTIRFSLEKKPTKLKFKIYDTQGTSSGAVDATNKAVKDGVRVFIGPIFSDVTKVLKETFKNKNLIFFSLSTDESNKSKRVIITGQSPDDQIKCIAKNLVDKSIRKILLIYHDDKYGEVVKNSLLNSTRNLNLLDQVELDFFKIFKNQDLNQEIKILSKFEVRKEKLDRKIESVKKSTILSDKEKKEELKKLDRKLTLDVPFDSIIIASEGDKLLEIMSHLAFYDINSNNTILYGTSIWEDTSKRDKIYENTFFVSNLKNEAFNFKKEYFEIFDKTPRTITFQLFDLIELIKDFQNSESQFPEDKIYIGEFGNSFLKDGFLHREAMIKKVKNEKIINSSKCYLNVL